MLSKDTKVINESKGRNGLFIISRYAERDAIISDGSTQGI